MTDFPVRIVIDNRAANAGIDRLSQSLTGLERAGRRVGDGVQRGTQGARRGLSNATRSADRFRQALNRTGDTRGLRRVRSELQNVSNDALLAQTRLGGLRGAFGALGSALPPVATGIAAVTIAGAAAVIGITKLGTGIATTADRIRLLKSRFEVLTGSERAFDLIFESANRLGFRVDEVGDTFGRFALIKDSIGATTEQVVRLNETVLKLGRIGGSSIQEIAGGTRQLTQGLGTGALRGEELRSVLENLQPVAKIIADEFGVDPSQLLALGEAGELSADRIASALLRSADVVDERFRNLGSQLEQSTNRVANEFDLLVTELDKKLRVSETFQFFTEQLARSIRSVRRLLEGDFGAPGFDELGPSAGSPTELRPPPRTRQDPAAQRAAEQRTKAIEAFLQSTEAANRATQNQIDLLGQTPGEIARANIELDKQNLLQKRGGELTDAQAERFRNAATEAARVATALADAQASQSVDAFLRAQERQIEGIRTETELIGQSEGTRARILQQLQQKNSLEDISIRNGGRQVQLTEAQRAEQERLNQELQRTVEARELAARAESIRTRFRGADEDFVRNLEALRVAQSRFGLSSREAAVAQREFRLALLETKTDIDSGVERAFLNLKTQTEDLASVAENAITNSFQQGEDAIVDFVTTGRFELRSFVDFIQREFARVAVRQAITGPLLGATGGGDFFGSLFGSITGALGFGGGEADLFSIAERFNTGGSFKIGPNSGFGPISGPDERLVPILAKPGEIVNVDRSTQRSRGGDTIVNVENTMNFNGPTSPQDVIDATDQMFLDIGDSIRAASARG